MPAVPIYSQQTQAGGTIGAQASPDDFGAGIDQALSRVGSGLQSNADAGMLMRRDNDMLLKQQAEKDARSWAGVTASQAQLDWTQQLQDRKNSALPGAPDFTPGILNDFDKYAATTIGNAPTPMAKEFISSHMTALRTQLGDQAIQFQGAAKVGLRVDNAQTTIENSAKLVQQDPSQYGASLNLIRNTMPDVGPEITAKLNDKAIASLTAAAGSQVLDSNPYAMRDLTSKAMGANGFTGKTGTPWMDDASPEQVKAWNSAAETKINMLENANARNQEARERAAASMVSDASDLSLKGQFFSPSYVNQLRTATAGTSFASGAETLINGQAQVSHFATASASDRNAVLNMLRTPGATPGQGTDPQSAQQVQKIGAVDNEIRKAVADNPWKAAQSYGVTTDASLANISSPDDAVKLIATRAQTQNQVETWAGQQVSPLQPGEAAQLGDVLSKMDPPARAQALAQIGTNMPLGRLEALADQLDSKDKPQALALKLGSDQTTAGRTVGELVLRGAQSIADKTIKKDDSTLTGWRAEISEMVRGTLGSQKAEQDVIDSAYYVRAAMENDGNAVPGFGMTATSAQAVRLVIGSPMERNGVKTLLPKGMDESGFDKALSNYTPEALKTVAPDGTFYLRGQPVPLQNFSDSLSRYGMQRDGKGNYLPMVGGAFITTDKAGQTPLRLPVSP